MPASEYHARLAEADRMIREQAGMIKQLRQGQPDLKSMAEKDPWAAVEALGLDIDQVMEGYTQRMSQADPPAQQQPGQRPPPAQDPVRQEIAQLRQQVAVQHQQLAIEREVDALAQEARRDDGDRWEMIRAFGRPGALPAHLHGDSYRLALQVAVEAHQQTGRIPDRGEVLDKVEAFLLGEEKKRLESLTKIGKLKQAAPAAAAPAPAPAPTSVNPASTTPVTPVPDDPEEAIEQQRLQAIEALSKE
jgi:hypothetical protein